MAIRAIGAARPLDTSRATGAWKSVDRTSLGPVREGAEEAVIRASSGGQARSEMRPPGVLDRDPPAADRATTGESGGGSARTRWRSVRSDGRATIGLRVPAVLALVGLTACVGVEGTNTAVDAPVDNGASSTLHVVDQRLANGGTLDDEQDWTTLLEGPSLDGWEAGVYGDDPELEFTEDGVVLPIGVPISGITYRGEAPSGAFTLVIEATKQYGSDFFLGVTFPVRDAHLTLVLGGWGGSTCGLSNLDGRDASENDTTTLRRFPNGKRMTVLIEVDERQVRASIDGETVVDRSIEGVELSIRPEVEPSLPLGLASFATVTTIHSVRIRAGARPRRTAP